MQTVAPYGRWASPLQAAQVAEGKVSRSGLCVDGASLYWLEARPAEGGRVVLVRSDGAGDEVADHSPPGVSIRSRVHEYGGGAVCVLPGGGGAFAYVDLADQRIWLCAGAGVPPRALTPAPPAGESWRHGGLSAAADGRWVLAVREAQGDGEHGPGDPPTRCVVALSTQSAPADESVILRGHDFFGTPRLHPAGDRVVVVAWDHPDMPWDASRVVVAPLARRARQGAERLVPAGDPWEIAGGPAESVGQAAWWHDGSVRFVSDRAGWWLPYRHSGAADGSAPVPLTAVAAEFHGPDWVLGQSTMAELSDGTLVARRTSAGRDALVVFEAAAARSPSPSMPHALQQPCVGITEVIAYGDGIAFIGATADEPPNVWVQPACRGISPAAARPLRPAPARALDPADVARAEPFTLTGRSGRAIYGSLFRPTRRDTAGPPGSRPPLVVWCHGGPIAATQPGFDPALQYFSTRGFAVACVDYAGSTGYGRDYRCSLWGLWGVADAEDCLDTALQLAARGDVDPARMAIRGGSSGGLTALNALIIGEVFAAGVSLYGVTDLLGLAATTHDFEARSIDRLVGPLPGSEATYAARSPVRHAADIAGAVLLLQGTDDAVVPPAQSEHLRDALRAAGGQCEIRFFEGEGHGFRRADTLTAALESELDFYRRHLDL